MDQILTPESAIIELRKVVSPGSSICITEDTWDYSHKLDQGIVKKVSIYISHPTDSKIPDNRYEAPTLDEAFNLAMTDLKSLADEPLTQLELSILSLLPMSEPQIDYSGEALLFAEEMEMVNV
jgi:hypothetical protein